MTAVLEAPLKTADFKRAVQEHEDAMAADLQRRIDEMTLEVKAYVEQLFEDQRNAIVAAQLPALAEPNKIEFKVRQKDGVLRTVDTPQAALLLNGKGAEMQLVLTWKGQRQ